NVRYFSGFDTQFWESPTRPWFLVVPREGAPIAVVPEIGAAGMAATWVDDVRSWPAPRPEDDGVSLLAQALAQLPRRYGRIGAELGRESVVRMPLVDLERVREALPGLALADGTRVLRALRGVKSEAEIARIRHVCTIASDGFEALAGHLAAGMSEREACRRLRIDILARGADNVPFMPGVAGPGGYDNIIMGPTERVIETGDVLIIDTGATYDGYYCDFDRNYAFGEIGDAARRAHEVVWQATEAGIAAARPGATTSDVWRAQARVLESGGSLGSNVGRFGHGLGLELTEPPSNMPGDDTVLAPNMVITIEPGMEYAPGKMIVHEEDVVIRGDGAELLSRRAPREMPVVK
ncbi:MAG: Xaa-Pro peptidase family protein, partial [Gammaproteobacteria bacterium]|nr:Xaa-Pro peptidase family protein [Gammaproteobacteria bacterium]